MHLLPTAESPGLDPQLQCRNCCKTTPRFPDDLLRSWWHEAPFSKPPTDGCSPLQQALPPHPIDAGVRCIVKLRDGNEVEVAQVAWRDWVPAATRGPHCGTEDDIDHRSPGIV